MLTALFWTFYVLFFILCLFLILLVLIQKGRGGGLSSALGGGGNTAFGSKTGDVLTWATSIVFGVFMLLAIGLNLVANAQQAKANVASPTAHPTNNAPIVPGPDNGM